MLATLLTEMDGINNDSSGAGGTDGPGEEDCVRGVTVRRWAKGCINGLAHLLPSRGGISVQDMLHF